MKRYVLSMMLAVLFVPGFAFAQESEEPEDFELQMEMRERQMELQEREVNMDIEGRIREREMELRHREARMDIERKMQELELEKRRIELEHMQKEHKDKPHPLLFLLLVVHILCAIWVYMDIRQRNIGSGIWIVIAILTGLLGTLVYAVVRLGNREKSQT